MIVLGVLYFLSFGPVMALESRGHLKNHKRTSKLLALVYGPLIWSHHHTFLRAPIEAYVFTLWVPSRGEK